MAFFDELKTRYRDATHHVPAFTLGPAGSDQWASDDGEPQGTAGTPILHLMAGEGLTDCAVLIVRYFGGIKLGPGGLMRAYTAAARAALEDSGIHPAETVTTWQLEVAYPYLPKMEFMASDGLYSIVSATYGELVILTLAFPESSREALWERIRDMTSGSAKILTEVTKTT